MKTYSAKPADITHNWWIIDAKDLVVGRVATRIAMLLRGKHKPMFTPSMDCGDHVIVINAEKAVFTGRKRTDKTYFWHTGFPGGIKQRTAETLLKGDHPERVMRKAVERMLPKDSPLARDQFKKLHVYAGVEHPHAGQKPQAIDFASQNRKNTRTRKTSAAA